MTCLAGVSPAVPTSSKARPSKVSKRQREHDPVFSNDRAKSSISRYPTRSGARTPRMVSQAFQFSPSRLCNPAAKSRLLGSNSTPEIGAKGQRIIQHFVVWILPSDKESNLQLGVREANQVCPSPGKQHGGGHGSVAGLGCCLYFDCSLADLQY